MSKKDDYIENEKERQRQQAIYEGADASRVHDPNYLARFYIDKKFPS